MVPYVCPVFSMWFAYPVLLLFVLMSCMCSLYLVLNVLPVKQFAPKVPVIFQH
jgi:hypothetical protein